MVVVVVVERLYLGLVVLLAGARVWAPSGHGEQSRTATRILDHAVGVHVPAVLVLLLLLEVQRHGMLGVIVLDGTVEGARPAEQRVRVYVEHRAARVLLRLLLLHWRLILVLGYLLDLVLRGGGDLLGALGRGVVGVVPELSAALAQGDLAQGRLFAVVAGVGAAAAGSGALVAAVRLLRLVVLHSSAAATGQRDTARICSTDAATPPPPS